jgi:hypothetical protein
MLGPLLFPVYTNDLPRAVGHKALPIEFDDYTSILLTRPNNTQMQSHLNIVFEQLNYWFKSNLLFFNFGRTYLIQFNNRSKFSSDIQIQYEDKQILTANGTKFLRLL